MGLFVGGPALGPRGGTPDATGFVLDEVSSANPEGGNNPFRFDSFWRPDGGRVFTLRGLDFELAQLDVSPAWGIQPGDWSNRVTTANISNIRSMWWSTGGTVLFAATRVPSTIFRIIAWDQSATPYDLTVLGPSVNKLFSPQAPGGPQDHVWSADGLTMWIHWTGTTVPATGLSTILRYIGTVPFDPLSLANSFSASFAMDPDAGLDLHTWSFSTDGTKIYGMDGQFLVSWDLTIPFDITTAGNFQTGPTVAAGDASVTRGIVVRPDNTDIYVAGDQGVFDMKAVWFRE